MRVLLVTAALLLTTITPFAQAPYAGIQLRPIKALSEQQVADLQADRGMGLALLTEGQRQRYSALRCYGDYATNPKHPHN